MPPDPKQTAGGSSQGTATTLQLLVVLLPPALPQRCCCRQLLLQALQLSLWQQQAHGDQRCAAPVQNQLAAWLQDEQVNHRPCPAAAWAAAAVW